MWKIKLKAARHHRQSPTQHKPIPFYTDTMNTYDISTILMKEEPAWYQMYLNLIMKYINPFIDLIDTYPFAFVVITPICMFVISVIFFTYLIHFENYEDKPKKVEEKDEVIEKILDQVGNDKESWPVMLVNEVILLKNMLNEIRGTHA